MTTASPRSNRPHGKSAIIMAAAVIAAVTMTGESAAQECRVGNIEWLHQFGTATSDEASDVAVDASRNVYVVGNTDDALPGQAAVGGVDLFLRKYDSAGNEVWTRQFGTAGDDRA